MRCSTAVLFCLALAFSAACDEGDHGPAEKDCGLPTGPALRDLLAAVAEGRANEQLLNEARREGPRDLQILACILATDDAAAPWIAEVLATWGSSSVSAVPQLTQRLLRGTDAWPYGHALIKIGRTAVEDILRTARADAELATEEGKVALARTVGLIERSGHAGSRDLLTTMLNDPSEGVRAAVLRYVSDFECGAEMLVRALADASTKVKVAALQAAGRCRERGLQVTPELLGEIICCIGHPDEVVRVEAMTLAGDWGMDAATAIPSLTRALREEGQTRRTAALALLRLGIDTEQILGALGGAGADPVEELTVADALASAGPRSARAALDRYIALSLSPYAFVRARAARGIGLSGIVEVDRAREALGVLNKDSDASVKAAAADAEGVLEALRALVAGR